jgi:exonuclease III
VSKNVREHGGNVANRVASFVKTFVFTSFKLSHSLFFILICVSSLHGTIPKQPSLQLVLQIFKEPLTTMSNNVREHGGNVANRVSSFDKALVSTILKLSHILTFILILVYTLHGSIPNQLSLCLVLQTSKEPLTKYLPHTKVSSVTNLPSFFSYRLCMRLSMIKSASNRELLATHGDIEANPGPNNTSGKLLIGTYNISGCKKYCKLRRIMAWIFSKKKTDRFIFSLQETYITNAESNKVETLWREGLVISPSSGRARGVITVFSNSLFEKVIYSFGSPDGRLTIVIGEYNSNIDMFVSIYSPNSGKNAEFYTSFFAKISVISNKYKVDNVYISGDFNLVLVESSGSRIQSSYEKKLCKIIMDEMSQLGLACINDFNKHTWNRGDKFSILDYIFVPKQMADSKPNVSVQFGVDRSDHGAVQATLLFDLDKGRGLFKPNLAFLDCVELRSLFEAELFLLIKNSNPEWDPHTKLEYAKVMIRTKAAEFSLKFNKRTESKHDRITSEINKLQALKCALSSNPSHLLLKYINTECIDADLFSLNLELDKVLNDKTKILSNKSRLKWLEYGEKSNKYFLNLNKSFQNSSYFKSFLNNGKEVFDSDSKIKVVHEFYSELYDYHESNDASEFLAKLNLCSFSTESNNKLNLAITKNELATILRRSGDTASGPDGIGYKLLKSCWSFYGDILIDSWNYAMQTGILTLSHRESVICLLQKKGKDRRIIGNLRPITLSNCDIKVITKAITKRCNTILNSVLNPHQTAYIPGRIVHDNLRSIDIVKDMCSSHNIEGYLVSLDAKKAFDSVDHKFIDAVLHKFNCSNEFRNIVRVLYNNLTSRVLVNGHLTEQFVIRRSVKQGDALSCVLFIMCMETIITSINQNTLITNIKIKDLTIPKVLAFADDIAIIVANKSSIVETINEYNSFSKVSGLYLNVEKTEIMNLRSHIADESIMLDGSDNQTNIRFTSNVTICGKNFSLNDSAEHSKNVISKIDKLQMALNSWSRRSLSIFGRNLILKTFGLSQVIYSMQSSVFSDADLTSIEKICFNFLWNKKADKTKAYERISRIKLKGDFNCGGINAPDIRSIYKSLVLRQVLRSSAESCNHSINALQQHLARWNPDVIFQKIPESFSNGYVRLASHYYKILGDFIIKEILDSDDNGKLSKVYYNLIASEDLIAICNHLAPNSLMLNYTKRVIKCFGFSCVGQLINEFKFPSSDKYRSTMQFIINSTKLFQILADRRSLTYGWSHRDNFIIATNKHISVEKLSTKTLRIRFFNGCDSPLVKPEFSNIKKITHPKEREIIFYELHNVILSNSKLFEMRVVSSPLCEMCSVEQTSDHIFNHCLNAKLASKAYNELAVQFVSIPHLKNNIESMIKRLLYLNRNSKINSEVFNIAITNRINDHNLIRLTKEKRKELAIINKITLL